MDTALIRPVLKNDNKELAQVLRTVLIEMGVPKVGTAYADAALDKMYETYDNPKMAYYVVVENHKILGGAGVAPLQEEDHGICELQKMYFLPEARGRGLGTKMMEKCLNFAKESGYAKCYLETMPYMKAARKLYRKTGFKDLNHAMGNTGHYSCQAWMIKDL